MSLFNFAFLGDVLLLAGGIFIFLSILFSFTRGKKEKREKRRST
ncbi:hypothetical protein U8V97_09440 [Priestia filamentosa]|nr:hypothetical protein [Priestia filamentosa]MED3726058.1 hypothetical protein [Priestia filamentosa]